MISVNQIIQEVKESILETQDRIADLDLQISKFDISIKTIFLEAHGIEGKFSIGPLTLGLKRNVTNTCANTVNLTFKVEELDVELQGNLSERLVEAIVLMTKEIKLALTNYPEFDYLGSSVEVAFDITETGGIQVLFGHEQESNLFHSVTIYFE